MRFVRQDGNLSLALTGRSFAIPNNPAFQTNQFKVSYSIWLSAPQLHTPIAAKGNAWQTNLVADSEGWRSAFRSDGDRESEAMSISNPN